VSVPLKPIKRYNAGRICWLHKGKTGADNNVWALDNVQLLPFVPETSDEGRDKVAQFSLNLRCGNYPEKNKLVHVFFFFEQFSFVFVSFIEKK